jgi:hypothetical protein
LAIRPAIIGHDVLAVDKTTLLETLVVEIIAETSRRLRDFSLANMICSPYPKAAML